MKIEELVYVIAGKALELLEQRYHYRIPREHKKDIQATVRDNLPQYLKEAESSQKKE